jgi:flagellar biosynthesis/type III secretory pathway protein FliH
MVAKRQAQETKNKAKERKDWKFWLVRSLYEKGYNRGQVLDLFKFIDFILGLPAALDRSFWQDLKTYEAEKQVTYITSVEKIGFKRGQAEGLQKGIQEGIQEGRKEGIQEGIQTGKREVALSMLEEGIAVETIARVTKLSIEQIQALRA